ncbi:hypothetical protein CspeluHIS016_0404450 [Cutaneotrichosporon spelunceum]|uniref:Uncharacterized protein n=1 Tax=Cutaneotrichosporon spelunceum TaxID=1672016 RepID=A0AAD3TVE9_9TREE|nr:hypothetical protein CspeluHIS016_0404450 [Cutaneotrichosporon spelunceum]
MAARIPQMYEVRRTASHPSPPSSCESNPFATPNASVTNLAAPADRNDRNSTNLSSIGGLLMASDWEEPKPKPRGRDRSGTIAQPAPHDSRRQHDAQNLDRDSDDNHRSFFSDTSDIAPARVGASQRVTVGVPPPRGDSLPTESRAKSPRAPSPHGPQFTQRSQQGYPESPFVQATHAPSQAHPQAQAEPASILQPSVQALPVFAGAAPVSAMLAAPPRAHFSPRAPSPGSDNASIRGHDYLREKNATFREGEEEVFTPFSPRARQPGPRARAPGRLAGRKSIISTVDFWKRLSTVARSHDKESSFLAERRRTIWRNPMFVVPLMLTLVIVAAIVVWLAVKVSNVTSV